MNSKSSCHIITGFNDEKCLQMISDSLDFLIIVIYVMKVRDLTKKITFDANFIQISFFGKKNKPTKYQKSKYR